MRSAPLAPALVARPAGAAHALVARLALALTALLGLAACDDSPPLLVARDAWSRPTALDEEAFDAQVPGVAYLVIENRGGTDDRLLAASSEVCARIELHETRRHEGRMAMRPVEDALVLPAGDTRTFAPGGLHLMLLDMRRGLVEGESFELELHFATSPTAAIRVEVRR